MRLFLVVGICMLTVTHCFCQANKINISDIKLNAITLGEPVIKASGNAQFSTLTIIDSRFDSSSFGFYRPVSGKIYSLVAEKNAANDIADFLKNYLPIQTRDNTSGPDIVMVIKKLWLTNELTEDADISKNTRSTVVQWQSGVIATFEFYYGSAGVYTPLYRFDTAYTGNKNISAYAKEYIRDVLMLSVQKLANADSKKIFLLRKKMSLNDIVAYSRQQFVIPVVTTGSYKKGVYKTFEEFKNNNPSIINYEIKKDQLTDMIFTKEGNEEYTVRDAWGFCDGSHLYINSADSYFELIKKQNTFICAGIKSLSRNRHVKMGNVLMLGVFAGAVGKGNKQISYDLNLRLYELDMNTGELY